MDVLTRRHFLAVGSVGLLSGCSSLAGSSKATLGGISLVNTTSEVTEFHVVVQCNGEITHQSSPEVEPPLDGEGNTVKTIAPKLPDNPQPIAVSVQVGNQRRAIDLSRDRFDGECVILAFIFGMSEGALSTTVDFVSALDNPPEVVNCRGN